jgi:hypothetical protein
MLPDRLEQVQIIFAGFCAFFLATGKIRFFLKGVAFGTGVHVSIV